MVITTSNAAEYLADRFAMSVDEFSSVAGNVWHVQELEDEFDIYLRLTSYGYDVAIVPDDLQTNGGYVHLNIGPALGEWVSVSSLCFSVGQPIQTVTDGGQTSPDSLREAISAASRAKALTLTQCRFCGAKVPLEYHFESDCCQDCATSEFGVLF